LLRFGKISFPSTSNGRCSSSFFLNLHQTTQSFDLPIFFDHSSYSDSDELSHTTTVGPSSSHQNFRFSRPTDRKKGGADNAASPSSLLALLIFCGARSIDHVGALYPASSLSPQENQSSRGHYKRRVVSSSNHHYISFVWHLGVVREFNSHKHWTAGTRHSTQWRCCAQFSKFVVSTTPYGMVFGKKERMGGTTRHRMHTSWAKMLGTADALKDARHRPFGCSTFATCSCSRSNHRFRKKFQLLLAIVHPLCGSIKVEALCSSCSCFAKSFFPE